MARPRVLLDTNVLVSALLFGGPPGRLLDAARSGQIEGVVSLHILGELRSVLTRPRFGFDRETADLIAEEIAEFCEVVPLERADAPWSVDPDDDPVVEAAMLARVSVVVTGDEHLLGLRLSGLRFVRPSTMLESLDER